ncbi:DoxX family protein [Mesorhizobium australicum]|uniref:Putative oxidoreductase n=1 Tax=Mesorhizobium australicum TaxID=536018 RepID=A0A1X7NQN5_9HYPH|nr:DoxX family protein [Mesorhizobium australicum]SMH39968.1 putative oxidoreductase [Mesorhizobium australicum]
MTNAGLLVARIMIALMFLASGYGALMDLSAASAYFGGLGLPVPLLVAVGTGLFEIAAGALLVVGFQTRIVAAVLAAFCLFATYVGHYGQTADAFTHQQMLLKDIAVAGGLILVALFGGGVLSLDAWLARRNKVSPLAENG